MKNILPFLVVVSLVSSLGSITSQAACSANDAEYEAGLKAYQARDYKGAAEHFDKSIQKGNKSAAIYLYSANCFSSLGQYGRAFQTYQIVTTSFKGSAEAAAANKSMEIIRSKSRCCSRRCRQSRKGG